jgi:hypothetical protein
VNVRWTVAFGGSEILDRSAHRGLRDVRAGGTSRLVHSSTVCVSAVRLRMTTRNSKLPPPAGICTGPPGRRDRDAHGRGR